MKKLLSIILCLSLLFAVAAPASAAAITPTCVGSQIPIVFIAGDGEPIYDENDKQILKISENGLLGLFDKSKDETDGEEADNSELYQSVANVLMPFLVDGLLKDNWQPYFDHLEKEIGDLFAESRLDNNGNAPAGTGISSARRATVAYDRTHNKKGSKVMEDKVINTANCMFVGLGSYDEYRKMNPYSSDHYEFIYEKGKITSIEVYNGSEREAVYAITHEGGKITKIAYTPFGSQSTETHPLPSCVLDLGLPVQKGLNGLNGPKATAYEYEFEWSGKNVKHCTYRSANYIEERFFTYDKMLNPLCGLWEIDGLDFQMMVSKNNVSRVEIHSDNSIRIMDYSYSYQGDVPTVATGTSTSSSATDRMTYSLSIIYDYQ